MVNRIEYMQERRAAAEALEKFNRKACIHFAEILRDHDTYQRYCREVGVDPKEIIPKRFFEIVYSVLSLGKGEDRAVLLLGSAESIEKLIERIEDQRGFLDEKDFWI